MTVTKADQLVRTYPNKETQRHELKRILDEPRKKEASQKRSPQSVDNAKGKKIELSKDDKERVKALDTSTKIIDLLKSSQLIRMPKSNNYRKLAFQEVINWLKVEMRRL